MLSIKEIRDGFSKEILNDDEQSDYLKTQIMEINEIFNEQKEQ